MCIPRKVASRTTSRHHRVIINIRVIIPKAAVNKLSPWNQQTVPTVVVSAPIAAAIGQGLRSTMWNGCWCLNFLFIFSLRFLRGIALLG